VEPTLDVPRRPWRDLLRDIDFQQGHHVSILGPTGSGKTYLAKALLPRRRYVVVLSNKKRDPEMTQLVFWRRYVRERNWPPSKPPQEQPRVVLWPDYNDPSDMDNQRDVFRRALRSFHHTGGWAVYIDEVDYLSRDLGLADELESLWRQGRTLNVSVIGATQRPAGVPLAMYSQAQHLFVFRTPDRRDRDRLSEIGSVDGGRLGDIVADLRQHEFAYVDARTGGVTVSKVGGR
jgi:energy-coupling factor transporter ATP-binding protein EcfA2